MIHEEFTDRIIRAYFNVYNELGYGFLEKVYESAMQLELNELGLNSTSQMPIDVYYKGEKVGSYFADMVVEGEVIVELKAAEEKRKEHEVQLTNYLKATEIEVGLLLNFGKKPKVKRKIYTNEKD